MPHTSASTDRPQLPHKLQKAVRPRRNTTSTSTTNTTTNHLENVPEMSKHQCCGVVEEVALQVREKRANGTKPQPWIVQKLMVFFTLGLIGYAGYVYIGRFCVNGIKRTSQSTTGRPTAIALLVIFCILYLWMIWAYIKVVLTPPGFARDYVSRSPQPLMELPDTRHSDLDLENSLSHYNTSFEPSKSQDFDPTRTHRHKKPSHSSTSSHAHTHSKRLTATDPIAGPSYEDIVLRTSSHGRSASFERIDQAVNGGETRGGGDAPIGNFDDGGVGQGRLRTPYEPPFSRFLPEEEFSTRNTAEQDDVRHGHAVELGTLGGREPRGQQTQALDTRRSLQTITPMKDTNHDRPWMILLLSCAMCRSDQSPNPKKKSGVPAFVRRRPPMTPVLHPAHRYCTRDEIVKPHRAHHCRSCATCVLKFDHHCPWIGQCVGARNHKFFLNFCQAGAVFTLYVLGTLVGFNAPAWASTSASSKLDPQIIVISSLAALFALFTSVLTCTHILLIMKGQTTVESMMIGSMKERESSMLSSEYGLCGFRAKRKAKRQWNEEWGNLDTEGNIWWTGSSRQGWIDVMGIDPLGWILPIGRSIGDGLSYPVNPRFDEQGRIRRRAEWPAELR